MLAKLHQGLLQSPTCLASVSVYSVAIFHTPGTSPPSWSSHLPNNVDLHIGSDPHHSGEDLLIGPLSSLPLNSFTNRRRTYPRTKQGLATCSTKLPTSSQKSSLQRLDFQTVGIFGGPPNSPWWPCPSVRLRLNQREKTCFLPVYCRAGLKWHTNRVKLNKYNTPPESQFLSRVQDVDPLTVWVLLTSNQPARDHYRKWKCQHWPLGTNLHNWPKFTFTNAVKNIQHTYL